MHKKKERVLKLAKNESPESWISVYQRRARLESRPSVSVFCGFYEVPVVLKEKLKEIKDEIFTRFPFEKLEKRPAFYIKYLEGAIPHITTNSKAALEQDKIGSIALCYLEAKNEERVMLMFTVGLGIASFGVHPLTLIFARSAFVDFKLFRRAKRMLRQRLIEVLGEANFEQMRHLKFNKTGWKKLEEFFSKLGYVEEALTVRQRIRDSSKKKANSGDALEQRLLDDDADLISL
jgi:hypothetical protein